MARLTHRITPTILILLLSVIIIVLSTHYLNCNHEIATPNDQVEAQTQPTRGIAVLSSDIGTKYPVEALAEFVEGGRFSPVIIDWAWVTYHWERTDFIKVNQFIGLLSAKGVETIAMYRPRFLSNPTVPTQTKSDGSPVDLHGFDICFSSSESCRWGIAWGEGILQQCPGFNEIIIYNPLNICECPLCKAQRSAGVSAYDSTWLFLEKARTAWQLKKPSVKLGVVYNPVPDFWARGRDIVDSARPFLYVRQSADMPANVADALAIQRLLGQKMKSALAKAQWEEGEVVSMEKLAQFNRLMDQNNLPHFFWLFDTLFVSNNYDPAKVAAALGLDFARIKPPLDKLNAKTPQSLAGQPLKVSSVPPPLTVTQKTSQLQVQPISNEPEITFPYPETSFEKLPLPHQAPGLSAQEIERLYQDLWVINNFPLYQSDKEEKRSYIHGGLDFILKNGTKIYAMKDGWVKSTKYSSIIIADIAGAAPSYGWSYQHLDKLKVNVGDFVRRGTYIGDVNFDGLEHIHLEKVFSEGSLWGTWHYICPPERHFNFKDNEPPVIKEPFYFFKNNSDTMLPPNNDGETVLNGAVDFVVGIRDPAPYSRSRDSGFGDRLAAAKIICTISRETDTAASTTSAASAYSPSSSTTPRINSVTFTFDADALRFKDCVPSPEYRHSLATVLCKHWRFFEPAEASRDKSFSYYIITNCSKGAAFTKIQPEYGKNCWDTYEVDSSGILRFPNGRYKVDVTASDFNGNSSRKTMIVRVKN